MWVKLAMSCRRRCLRLRTRKALVFMIILVIFLGMVMTYRTLNVQNDRPSPSSSLPSLDNRRSIRFRPREDFHIGSDKFNIMLGGGTKNDLSRKDVDEVLTILYPPDWKIAREPDEVAIDLKDHMFSLNLLSPMSCHEIDDLQIGGSLGSSAKKFVERLTIPDADSLTGNSPDRRKDRKLMVMKSQANDVRTKIACMKQIYNADFCSPMGNYLLMREVFFLTLLQHPSLIRVLGYCLRGDHISLDMRKKGVMLVTEFGMPLSAEVVSALSWARRVRLALDAATLLEFLQSSPLGSLGLPHVQMKDFVIVGHTTLKLTDLDDIELEERKCTSHSDCLLQESEVGVECREGHCKGLNLRMNMQVFDRAVLHPLLQKSPPEEEKKMETLLNDLKQVNIFPADLTDFLLKQTKKYAADDLIDESQGYKAVKKKPDHHLSGRKDDYDFDDDDDDEDDEIKDNVINTRRSKVRGDQVLDTQHHLQNDSIKQRGVPNPQVWKYKRLESSNFPGMYDYICPDSRVLWGCVMTFGSLVDAMDHCSVDVDCRSFAVFSSHPDDETRMTVVFKEKNNGVPHVNLGVTLFLKTDDNLDHDEAEPTVSRPAETTKSEEKSGMKAGIVHRSEAEQVKNMQMCMTRNLEYQFDALRSREKRLMAHMGMKDMMEKDWKRAVRTQPIFRFSSARALSGQRSHGGQVILFYDTSTPSHKFRMAKFLVEEGEWQNHIAFALVYHLDRLLGLYHTPPATDGFIPADIVKKFDNNTIWHNTFSSLTHSDGTLRGLLVAPTPAVVKRANLTLLPRIQMATKVTPFQREQKLQLEYVLLWWLAHIKKPSQHHRGFKGHLIHVDADHGFQEPASAYDSYFYHCQFPNVVYKMLACFRCSSNTPVKICHLGQEAVRRLEDGRFRLADLQVRELTERDYPALINRAASQVLEIVDDCVHKFGREAVLY